MRIALDSDLHREAGSIPWQPPALNVHLVILAGDIGSHTNGIEWASRAFRTVPEVVYVAGNHEYYNAHLGLLDELENPVWDQMGVHFLERRVLTLEGVRVLGCTLWSGFDLYGAGTVEDAMNAAKGSINDYWMIRARGGKLLTPRDTLRLHRTDVRWLETELAKPFDGKTVVVTHFAPHRRCIAPEHAGSAVTPYFVTDLSRLMEAYSIELWCFGHTHTNVDFIAEGGCRVISNQLGYPKERVGAEHKVHSDNGFQNEWIIEI